jgi:hypothetical protein
MTRVMRRLCCALVVVLFAAAWPRAMEVDLDTRAIQRAIDIGQSRLTGERERFHAPYRVRVAMPPVDDIVVITPFRRIVLDAQAQEEAGNHTYGQRNALEALAAAPGVLEVDVELTFHPLNTFVGVPDYRVAIVPPGASAPRIDPLSTDRIPRFGPRVAGGPLPLPQPGGLTRKGRSSPMLGGTLVARFDARMLDATGRYDVVISEGGKELARGRMDLEKLR